MNYLDVAKIVQAIDDYFLLFDPLSGTIIRVSENSSSEIDGLIICRNLRNGRIDVTISSLCQGKESIAVSYHKRGSKNNYDCCASLNSENLTSQSIANAIRKMITYDNEVQKPRNNDLVLSPNNQCLFLSPQDETIY